MAKKGYNPDGSLDKSQTFTNGNTGVTTYGDGSPAPSAYQQVAINQQQGNEAAFTARGYDMQGKPYGPNPRYMNPKTGMIDLTSPYQDPKAEAPAKAPANVSGGQATVPSVQQRMMSRMGQAVQKGVNKGKIKSSQLSQYQVPGQAPAATASPLVSQLAGSVADRNRNIPSNEFVNYTGQASAAQKALNPVPMPRKQ